MDACERARTSHPVLVHPNETIINRAVSQLPLFPMRRTTRGWRLRTQPAAVRPQPSAHNLPRLVRHRLRATASESCHSK